MLRGRLVEQHRKNRRRILDHLGSPSSPEVVILLYRGWTICQRTGATSRDGCLATVKMAGVRQSFWPPKGVDLTILYRRYWMVTDQQVVKSPDVV